MPIYFKSKQCQKFMPVKIEALYGILGSLPEPDKAFMECIDITSEDVSIIDAILTEFGLPKLKIEKQSAI